MKYGISYPNGDVEMFRGKEAAGEARMSFATVRALLMAGESARIFGVTATGAEITLDSVTVH